MDRLPSHAVSRSLKIILFVALSCATREAFACGVGGGIGPSGMCTWGGAASQPAADSASAPVAEDLRWRVAASYGYSHTIIDFSGHTDIDITRHLALVTTEYRADARTSISVTVGGVVAGETGLGSAGRVDPGIVGAFATSWRVLDQKRWRPFIVLTGTIAVTSTPIRVVRPATTGTTVTDNSFTALDFRAGISVGGTFWKIFTPYVAGRLFGGPVFYRIDGSDRIGNDRYHFQLGAGALLALGTHADLFFEGIPLGEQALSGGIALHL